MGPNPKIKATKRKTIKQNNFVNNHDIAKLVATLVNESKNEDFSQLIKLIAKENQESQVLDMFKDNKWLTYSGTNTPLSDEDMGILFKPIGTIMMIAGEQFLVQRRSNNIKQSYVIDRSQFVNNGRGPLITMNATLLQHC